MYLRHKLQRGLLTRDQQPQESEMEQMSGFITMLENFDDLEVSIIRATKINKVLKAILKLDSVPKEEEFGFKKRSQTLLDKWNKLLAVDAPPAAANGVNGSADAAEKKSETNGVDDVAEKETAPEAAELAEKSADTPTKKEEAVEETVSHSRLSMVSAANTRTSQQSQPRPRRYAEPRKGFESPESKAVAPQGTV